MALYYELDEIVAAFEGGELTVLKAIQEAYDLGYGQGVYSEQCYCHADDETD
jgi:hypothetical protein